jgi:hypothetical protein
VESNRPSQQPGAPVLLTEGEAAALLRISVRSLRRERERDRIRVLRTGVRSIRYDLDELRRYMA